LDQLDEAARRVQTGDTQAFQQIVEATSAELVRLGARMTGSVADAEDVVQDAYVKAYRSLVEGGFDQRSSVRTWLYRIVTNASIDALRARGRGAKPTADVADTVADSSRSPFGSAEAHVALGELADWLSELPPDQRAAIVLKAVEGFSSAEVARILECSEGAVEQRLVRARAA
jgi:RNA polymerase sigma-70 factor, ECF subfamily